MDGVKPLFVRVVRTVIVIISVFPGTVTNSAPATS